MFISYDSKLHYNDEDKTLKSFFNSLLFLLHSVPFENELSDEDKTFLEELIATFKNDAPRFFVILEIVLNLAINENNKNFECEVANRRKLALVNHADRILNKFSKEILRELISPKHRIHGIFGAALLLSHNL